TGGDGADVGARATRRPGVEGLHYLAWWRVCGHRPRRESRHGHARVAHQITSVSLGDRDDRSQVHAGVVSLEFCRVEAGDSAVEEERVRAVKSIAKER